ncbi:unnamed protein product [Symbiodinium natans]|uniref:Uncharacterized protein n=1 Tax=Symbiodinium natans TaxID=878477 RepID=A0A812UQM8_9DINO|nr:unnamed protein product [Symbiodinium natans]
MLQDVMKVPPPPEPGYNMRVFIGPISSELSEVAANVTSTHLVPILLPFSSLPDRQLVQTQPWISSLEVLPELLMARPIRTFHARGAKTVALWVAADPYLLAMCQGAADEATHLGMSVVYHHSPGGNINVLEEMRLMAAQGPDVFVVCSEYKEGVEIMMAIDFLHFTPQAILMWDSARPEFSDALLVASALSIATPEVWSSRIEPCNLHPCDNAVTRADFASAYESRHTTEPSLYAAQAAAAGMALTVKMQDQIHENFRNAPPPLSQANAAIVDGLMDCASKESFYQNLCVDHRGYLASPIMGISQLVAVNVSDDARRLQPGGQVPGQVPGQGPGQGPVQPEPPQADPISTETLLGYATLTPQLLEVYELSKASLPLPSMVYPRPLEDTRQLVRYPCEAGFEVITADLFNMLANVAANSTGGPQTPCFPCLDGTSRDPRSLPAQLSYRESGRSTVHRLRSRKTSNDARTACEELCAAPPTALWWSTPGSVWQRIEALHLAPGYGSCLDSMSEGDGTRASAPSVGTPGMPATPDESEGVPSKGLRRSAVAFAAAATAFLVWSLASERWHCFQVEVPPSEIYEMFKAMVAILPPGGHPTNFSPALRRKLERSTDPHVAFELQSGLWSGSAKSLCKPSDSIFSVFVDSKMCQAKLLHFCDDILDGSKDDPIALSTYENCRHSVSKGGVSLSFVLEPPAKLEHDMDNEYTTLDGLQSELGHDEQDQDPDICDTLADCDVLVAMRPLNLLLISVMILATLLMAAATVFFARALFGNEEAFTKRGCNVMFLAGLSLAAVIGLDIYLGEKYPLEDVFRVEDLYYFMLPDGSDSQGSGYSSLLGTAEVWSPSPAPLPQLSKRSQKHWGVLEPEPGPLQPRLHPESSMLDLEDVLDQVYNSSRTNELQLAVMKPLMQIPPTKWKGALAVLGANLMAALATKNMGAFLDPLKDAAKRAWGKSDVIINSWLQYLQQSIIDAPGKGGDQFDSMLNDFQNMKSANDVCDTFGLNACNSLSELEDVKAEATTLFSSLRSVFQEKLAQAKKLIAQCMKVLSKMKAFWKEVQEPVKRIMALVVEAAKDTGSGLLNSVVNALGKPELLDDIRLLFQKLFTSFPHVVLAVRQLADHFVSFVQGLKPVILQLKDAAIQVKKLLTRGLDKAQVILAEEADNKEAQIKFKISKEIDAKVNEAAGIWGIVEEIKADSATQNGAGSASNSSSLLEQAASISGDVMGLISNFASAGKLCSPAARVGTIFLSEIQHMHATARGFETKRGGVFQHFGYITFCLILLLGLVVVSFAMFHVGFLK